MISSITMKKNFRRILPRDLSITLIPGLNVVVGDQGCGKSSLLNLIAAYYGPNTIKDHTLHWPTRKEARECVDVLSHGKDFEVHYVDFERDLPRGRGHFMWDDKRFGGVQFQINSAHVSHGQAIVHMMSQTFNRAIKKPGLVLLDEPESAMSPRSITILMNLLRAMERAGNQIIVATHHPWIVGMNDQVLCMETRGWMPLTTYSERIKKSWNVQSIMLAAPPKPKKKEPIKPKSRMKGPSKKNSSVVNKL